MSDSSGSVSPALMASLAHIFIILKLDSTGLFMPIEMSFGVYREVGHCGFFGSRVWVVCVVGIAIGDFLRF